MRKKINEDRGLVWAFSGIMILSAFFVINIYMNLMNDNDNILIIFGCSIFLIICIVYIVKKILNAKIRHKEIEYYRTLAYIDTLTKIPNRTALDKEIKSIENDPVEYTAITCIIFDLNYLKKINDTFGHIAGDNLIKGTGCCLRKTFEGTGLFFRHGGDEFAVILKNLTEEEVAEIMNVFFDNVTEYNNTHEYKIDISWGIATSNKNQDIRKLLRLADERMYAKKKEMKVLH